MKNFKNDALTTAEQNNVEGGWFFLRSLWAYKLRRYYSYGGCYSGYNTGCNTGCNSGCNSGCGYGGW